MTDTKSTKPTKRDFYTEITEIAMSLDREDIVAFCDHEIDLRDKKRGGVKDSLTQTQKDNLVIKENIHALLTASPEGMRAGAIATALDVAPQKVTALLTQMVNKDFTVERTEEKKVVTFTAL